MKRFGAFVLLTLALASSLQGQQPHKRPGSAALEALPRTLANRADGSVLGSGTVQYDPGAPADGLLFDPVTFYFGNRFDTRNGAPLSPGTLTGVSWYQGSVGRSVGTGAAGFIFYAPYGGAATDILFFSNPVSFTFNSGPVSLAVGTDFVAGFEAPGPAGPFGSVGMRSASTNAQGFHGLQRSFNPGIRVRCPGRT